MNMADEQLYYLIIFDEMDILSNMLAALAAYRFRFKGCWPRKISIHPNNRLSIGMGEDMEVERVKWSIVDAVYLHAYMPIKDITTKRTRTPIPKKRHPVTISGVYKRRRSI